MLQCQEQRNNKIILLLQKVLAVFPVLNVFVCGDVPVWTQITACAYVGYVVFGVGFSYWREHHMASPICNTTGAVTLDLGS